MDGNEKGPDPRQQAEAPSEGIPEPTVGRVVHFFTKDTSKHHNGQGEGPYLALVTQTWGGLSVNLKVLPPFGPVYDEGSVPHSSVQTAPPQWWKWPPYI